MNTEKALFPIARMAHVLKVSVSGFCSWVKARRRDSESVPARVRSRRELDRRVRRIWVDSHQAYGSPRIHAQLRRAGAGVDRKTVAASMRCLGIEGVSPRRFRPVTTLPGTRTHSVPDRCKRLWDTGEVNRVWVSDIAYLRTRQGWVYLCGVKDTCSRKIVATAMSTTMTTDVVGEALRRAQTLCGDMPKKVVLHSDGGARFASERMYQCCVRNRNWNSRWGEPGCAGIMR